MIVVTSVTALPDTHALFILKEDNQESFLDELIRFSSIYELTLATVESVIISKAILVQSQRI